MQLKIWISSRSAPSGPDTLSLKQKRSTERALSSSRTQIVASVSRAVAAVGDDNVKSSEWIDELAGID